jgi:hypothetical protein
MRYCLGIAAFVVVASSASADPLDTQTLMLSGHGPADAVPWDFTIDGGMRAGEKATIAVPSNWQQQGFGHYLYGNDRARSTHDHGIYHRRFTVPAGWTGKTIRLVFDAAMTDTVVKVNGVVAGPVHQGGFNRFSFDVTKLVKRDASNDLEVDVGESSAATDTDIAERKGDYWTFGGIYRPVWLEARPAEAIAHVAIDGQASGTIAADVTLADPHTVTRLVAQVVDAKGVVAGAPFDAAIPAGGTGSVTLHGKVDAPRLWTAETPNLYFLDVTLFRGDAAVHRVRTRFGFRTFEVREGQGLYLNGQKIILKGVNRHSFRPDTARALDPADSVADVRLIRSMNMNAVRMSHYSPEESFLEAADELGLYVLDELSGWQHAHDTDVGRKLVRELVERDVNHPSILFWDNGNEGGFNRELDPEYARFDPQHRKVLHPWEPHDGVDTKHYPRFADFVQRLNGPTLVMPTEFQHGLYDGGAGAGLDDYWKAVLGSPRGAGGFIWSFADEGVARTDQAGRIDTAATYAPDGIVGPRHELEPSYFTVRDIWSPIQIATPTLDAAFEGMLKVANRYDFTPASALRFQWQWVRFSGPKGARTDATIVAQGEIDGPAIAPHGEGAVTIPQPAGWRSADALRLTARLGGEPVAAWVWPVAPARPPLVVQPEGTAVPRVERTAKEVRLIAGASTARFDAATGMMREISRGGRTFPITGGPHLVFARPSGADPVWSVATLQPAIGYVPAKAGMTNVAEVDLGLTKEQGWASFALQISADGKTWQTVFAGDRTPQERLRYTFPPQIVAAIRVQDLTALRGTLQPRSVRLGYEADRFAPVPATAATVSTGTERDPATGKLVAWLDAPGAGGFERAHWSLQGNGSLTLDYRYRLDGAMLYHGAGFDVPLAGVAKARLFGRGPQPVWQNRLRGPLLGVYDVAARGVMGLPLPDHAGYFADPRWLRLDETGASLVVTPSPGTPFLQLGAKLEDHPNTSPEFPASTVGLLQAIPAMGNKFDTAAQTGPAGAPSIAAGVYTGRVTFDLVPR